MSELAEMILEDAACIADKIDFSLLDHRSVLVTGASGLLGSYIMACLAHRSKVSGRPLDITAVTRSPLLDYLRPLFDFPGVRVCTGDLGDYAFCRSLPGSDITIHAAGYGQPGKFLRAPIVTMQLNTMATAILLEKLHDCGQFVFLSTSELYSGSTRVPHREDDIGTTDPSHPRAGYIEGKRCGEAMCHAYRRRGVDVKIARLALAYGPGTRVDDQRVLNNLVFKALVQGQIALLDHGRAYRTYGYITDVIEMLFGMLLFGQHAVYNLGGQSSITILELAQAIGRQLDVPVVLPAHDDQGMASAPAQVALDLSRVCQEQGKTDFVSMTTGLSRVIAWQRALLRVSK